MGREDIAEVGKQFSSEYQPAGRGRPKGSLNKQIILRHYLEERVPEDVIEQMMGGQFSVSGLLDACVGGRELTWQTIFEASMRTETTIMTQLNEFH